MRFVEVSERAPCRGRFCGRAPFRRGRSARGRPDGECDAARAVAAGGPRSTVCRSGHAMLDIREAPGVCEGPLRPSVSSVVQRQEKAKKSKNAARRDVKRRGVGRAPVQPYLQNGEAETKEKENWVTSHSGKNEGAGRRRVKQAGAVVFGTLRRRSGCNREIGAIDRRSSHQKAVSASGCDS